jgi:hypothetical protein
LAPASSIIEKLAQSSAHVQLNINDRKEFVQRKQQSVTYSESAGFASDVLLGAREEAPGLLPILLPLCGRRFTWQRSGAGILPPVHVKPQNRICPAEIFP